MHAITCKTGRPAANKRSSDPKHQERAASSKAAFEPRIIGLLLCLCMGLLCVASVSTQTTTTGNQTPGVTVLEWRWEKHTSNGLEYSRPPPPPVGLPNEPVPDRPFIWPAGGTSYFYYVQIKNAGPKVIRSMALDYVFSDLESKAELGRRSLHNFEKIDLKKTKWVEVRAFPSGPPKLTTVQGTRKDPRASFDEHVEIKCILYADGTGWRAADADAKTCDELVRLTLHPDARRK
jgi:hypothetical protein